MILPACGEILSLSCSISFQVERLKILMVVPLATASLFKVEFVHRASSVPLKTLSWFSSSSKKYKEEENGDWVT